MVVICDECGLKYQIDSSKIIGDKARFKCKGCSASIIVDKNEHMDDTDLAALDEVLLSGAPTSYQQEATKDDQENQNASQKADTGTASAAASSPAGASPTHKRRSGMGLTAKVILLMLVVSLVPGAVYFALSFKQTSDRIITETNKTGTLVSGLLASEVDEWIDKNVRALKALAAMQDIQNMNQFTQEPLLKALQSEYPWMYLVFTTDTRGMNVARSDGKPLTDYSNRQYVKDVVGGADIAWQNLIGKTSKKPALVLAVPIKVDDKIIGVMASAMTREAISDLVTTFRQGQTGSSFLVDEAGKAVAHHDNAFVLKQQDMSNHPLVQAAGHSIARRTEFIDANGKETIGFAKKTKLGWTLAIQQEKSEAFEPLRKAQFFAYTLLGITVVAILIIALLASRAIVTPIRRLTDAANRISIGDLEVEIENKSKDEIGDLADAITRMQDSIRLSISRLKRRRR